MLVALLGVVLGAFFSFRLDGAVGSLLSLAGISNPLFKWLLPPLLVFLGFVVGFGMLAQFIHHKASLFYAYRASDEDRLKWERLNDKLGTSIGVSMGGVYALLCGVVIYVGGYLTTQLKSPGENPAAVNFLNRARADMTSTGFDKLIAAIDPTPPSVYDAADVFGFVYNNPDLAGRLSQYPLFLALAEKPEFQDIAADASYSAMLQNQANIFALIEHPKTKAVLANPEIVDGFRKADAADLLEFVKTGKSPKYSKEKILGRWMLNSLGTVQLAGQKNPALSVPVLNRVRGVLQARMGDMVITADPLNQFIVRSAQGDLATLGTILGDKKDPLPPLLPTGDAPGRVVAQGTWKNNGQKYEVYLRMENAEKPVDVDVEGARLIVNLGTESLVFSKEQD